MAFTKTSVDTGMLPSPTDGELVAQIPAAMLDKLSEDSREKSKSSGLGLATCGMLLVVVKHFNFFGSRDDLVFLLLGSTFVILGLLRYVKFHRPNDEMVQVELQYRRQHGKWRWER
jgi:hypothetical protein